MKTLYIILAIVAAIIVLLLIIALFIKKEYTISREVTINKSSQEVFNYVKFIKNQDHFNKWVMADPNMKKVFTSTDGTIGFIYAWDSEDKNAGKGEQEIAGLSENKSIETVIRFEKPFEGTSYVKMTLDSLSENQTHVTWQMTGESKYPMNFMNLFMDSLLGNDMNTSLATLKNIIESK